MNDDAKNDRWSVLLGGDIAVTERLLAQVDGTRVIAADSGIRHAQALGVMPELWIGDFDSSGADLQAQHPNVPRQTHPPAKDATDGELAVTASRAGGARHITLVGAFGGRADQATAHMLIAFRLADTGVTVTLSDGVEEGMVVGAQVVEPDWPDGTLFSLLAFSNLRGVTITGALWPLNEVDIGLGDTLGLSNTVSGRVGLRVRSGRCLALANLALKTAK